MMMGMKAFGILGLGLVLNLNLQVSSQHLSCAQDEDLPAQPECPEGEADSSTFFPVPYDCRKYFECKNGVAKCFRCAPETVWDQNFPGCVHEDFMECVILTTTTPPSPPTTEAPEEPTTEPTTVPATEPSTTTPLPTDPPATPSTPSTTTRSIGHCDIDDPMPPPGDCPPSEPFTTYMPYPYDCRKYFQCSNGVAVCMRCANGTVWHQELEVCDGEANVGCVVVTTTPPAEQGNSVVNLFKNLRLF